ncbi:hypothetical protein [Pelagibius marinus]|uniref:hypothetical protein n=1 Tax=Pelagibius marinus TaxID=2762760 RepID=UPI0018727BBB|nr:hypothetical protein [Pelagibius marinus]
MRLIVFIALPTAVLAAGLLGQASVYLNHDVGWILYSSDLMLGGAEFGQDIITANPPLIWWISMIPNLLSDFSGLPVIPCFRLLVTLGIGAALIVSNRFLARQGASLAEQALFVVLGVYLLAVAVDRDFGQREHLAVLLLLPYLFAVAHRMEGRPITPIGALVLGAAAAVGVAFKPYFVLVPLLLEAALWWRTRSLSNLFRPEALGAILAIVAYAIALFVLAGPWLFEVAPDISRVYWAFARSLGGLAMPIAEKFALPALAALIVLRFNPSPRGVVLVLAAIGFFGAAALQAKYYTYHVYPAYALLAIAAVIGIPGLGKPWKFLAIGLVTIFLTQDMAESIFRLKARSEDGKFGQQIHSVISFVKANVPEDGSFLAISTHPYPGFPTALYAERTWASASNSAIFLPAVVRLRESGGDTDPATLAFAEKKAREALQRDLALAPDLVLVDEQDFRHAIGSSRFDFLDFYLEQAAFEATWRNYEQLPSAPKGFAAFRRKKE